MMGIGHASTGVLAAMCIGAYVHADVPSVILLCTSLPGFALLPDIDHPRATVSNTYGPLTRTLSRVLGHRRETHSVPGILLVAFCTYMATMYPVHVASKIWLTALLILCWSSVIRLFKIAGMLDDLFPIIPAVVIVWFPGLLDMIGLPRFPLTFLPFAVALGMLIHVLGDIVTKQGCPLMYPFSDKRTKLKIFKAGGKIEKYVIMPMIIIGTGAFLVVWISDHLLITSEIRKALTLGWSAVVIVIYVYAWVVALLKGTRA